MTLFRVLMEMELREFLYRFIEILLIFLLLPGLETRDMQLYEVFPRCLSEYGQRLPTSPPILFSSDDVSYTPILNSYIRNLRFAEPTTAKPQFIITVLRESDVVAAILCTKKAGLALKIRSGGHDYEGVSYVADVPFVILDMFNLRTISIDMATETAWIQSGATLGELYYEIAQHSRVHAFPAGVCPTVGVGGHITGGGYGTLIRKYGLSVDSLEDARIVDVDGSILDRNGMGEDLFWAIRGGGAASFGVILSYKVKLVRVPEKVTYFRVEKWGEEAVVNLVEQWQRVAPTTDENLFMRLLLQPVTPKLKHGTKKTIRGTVVALFLGPAVQLVSIMRNDFPELGLQANDSIEMDWITSVLHWNHWNSSSPLSVLLDRNSSTVNFLKRKSDYLTEPMSRTSMKKLFAKMVQLGKPGLVLNPYGGMMDRIQVTATPFPHRQGIVAKIQYSASWHAAAQNEECLRKMEELYEHMTPLVSKNPRRAFLNYRDLSIGRNWNGTASYVEALASYGRKYFAGNFERLVMVKSIVDPTNFFRNEQSIPTTSHEAGPQLPMAKDTAPYFSSLSFVT